MSEELALLDVNVLVAFLWPPHLHHRAARSWFVQAQPVSGFAEDDRHLFWPDDISVSDTSLDATTLTSRGRANSPIANCSPSLLRTHGGTFATFDRSVGSGLPASSELLNHLEIVAR